MNKKQQEKFDIVMQEAAPEVFKAAYNYLMRLKDFVPDPSDDKRCDEFYKTMKDDGLMSDGNDIISMMYQLMDKCACILQIHTKLQEIIQKNIEELDAMKDSGEILLDRTTVDADGEEWEVNISVDPDKLKDK